MDRPSRPSREDYSSAYSQRNDYEADNYIPLDSDIHLASLDEKKRLWWRDAAINGLFIASWFFFATILSVYNKWMFTPSRFNFPYPLFVTTIHMCVQFTLAYTARTVWPHHFRPVESPSRSQYMQKVAPTAFATSLDIGLSNFSLKTITLSFYTMIKSSSLIFVLMFAFLFRLEAFSWRLVGVIVLICCGVLLMVATETHFVLQGFLLVLSASALGGLRWGLTQILLKDNQLGLHNPVATIFWLSPTMGLSLAIISAVVERWHELLHSHFFATFGDTISTMLYLILPGFLAFFMVLSEFYILQRAGMVPMSIAGIAKEVTTIIISSWFFGDELTPLNIVGVGITVCGIALFTYHKYLRSVNSVLPVDEHGNAIAISTLPSNSASVPYELEERLRLRDQEDRASLLSSNLDRDGGVLFAAEDDDDQEAHGPPARGSLDH